MVRRQEALLEAQRLVVRGPAGGKGAAKGSQASHKRNVVSPNHPTAVVAQAQARGTVVGVAETGKSEGPVVTTGIGPPARSYPT